MAMNMTNIEIKIFTRQCSDTNPARINGFYNDIELKFKATSSDGQLLWISDGSNVEFLSVGLRGGFLHVGYNVGGGDLWMTWSRYRVDDAAWHVVNTKRDERTCFLTVDGLFQLVDKLPGFLAQLNTDSKLYIGGKAKNDRQATTATTTARRTSGVVGCIANIVLNSNYRLNWTISSTLGSTAVNVTECSL